LKLYDYRIIPSKLKYKSAPAVDQKIDITLNQTSKLNTEFDRITTVSLPQVYDNERQLCEIFRPTFQISYIYSNAYTGTTSYVPFRNNLFYLNPELSVLNNFWYGFPQFYEFDFFRPDAKDQHFTYESKSAYTYNWTYYISYANNSNYNKRLFYSLNNTSGAWIAKDGIPFKVVNTTSNGSELISFQCIAPHGLQVGESVELSFKYGINNLFEVYSLGNDSLGSDEYIFNIYNVGYTGNTFFNNRSGKFKRVIYPEQLNETRSKYYVREHKILTNVDEVIMTKTGFQKNSFGEEKKLYLSSITPNNTTRCAQKTSSNTYTLTSKIDIDLTGVLDNQKRPVSELFLTVIHKGYSGYFNKPSASNVGLKEGWKFNLTDTTNSWWDENNLNSDSSITTSSYNKTDISGTTKTFYYNNNLSAGDIINGDFCEWNDYEQKERVISPFYHKVKFNQDNLQTSLNPTTNSDGYYYEPHHPITIRVYSDFIETGNVDNVDNVPFYSFYSESDQEFRWRDLYSYGIIDNLGRGVNFPFLNKSHYPFDNVIFRFIPEGTNVNNYNTGINIPVKPKIDGCE